MQATTQFELQLTGRTLLLIKYKFSNQEKEIFQARNSKDNQKTLKIPVAAGVDPQCEPDSKSVGHLLNVLQIH